MSYKLELGSVWHETPKCYKKFAEAHWDGSFSTTQINELLEPYRATIHDNPDADLSFIVFADESDYLMFLMKWG